MKPARHARACYAGATCRKSWPSVAPSSRRAARSTLTIYRGLISSSGAMAERRSGRHSVRHYVSSGAIATARRIRRSGKEANQMIILHRSEPEKHAERWYCLDLTFDLFGNRALYRAWGSLRTSYQHVRCDMFSTEEEAVCAAQRMITHRRNMVIRKFSTTEQSRQWKNNPPREIVIMKPWRMVVKATWQHRGIVMSERNWRSGTGRYWFLQPECGHVEIRPFRYFQCTGFTTYTIEDALPAPRKVRRSQIVTNRSHNSGQG